MLTSFAACVLVIVGCSALKRCSQTFLKPSPWFHLIRTCALSSAQPLDEGYLQTVEECERLAVKRKALAFNFASPDDLQKGNQMPCLVYDCQETDPFTFENSLYDYYGVYRDLDPDSNLTCVPGLGMFHLHPEPANFSEAAWSCQDEGGLLARVTSPHRTHNLSSLVATLGPHTKLQRAYVGMSDVAQEGVFITVEDEPLDCFDFRGWAVGEPRSRRPSEDCVVLDSRRGWRTVHCGLKLPFLCELTEPAPDNCDKGRRKDSTRNCRASAESNRRKQRQRLEQCQYQTSPETTEEEGRFDYE